MKFKFIRPLIGAAIVFSVTACPKEKEPCETHTWDAGTITTAPTDNSDGIKTYTRTVCGEKKTEIVSKTGTSDCSHVWNDGTVITEPTATSDGIRQYTCTKCNATKLEVIPRSGENEEKYTVTYNANGGTGTAVLDLNQYVKGERVVVKANTFTAPEGYEFINWNESPDGTGGYYNANSTFKIYENKTLYAQWLPKEDIIIDENTEFPIKVNKPEGVTVTLSHDKAKKGTEVTLTVSLSEGITLNGEPASDSTTLSKVRENVYNFVMPQNAVTIYIKATIDGDVVLSGDIAAKLTDPDNDGVYSVDVACDDKTSYEFTYIVKDNNGEPKRLSSTKLDETRCDASVTFTSNKENALVIDGGCTYTFYYDSNEPDFNCYVVRKSVDVLPMNSRTLYSLFTGSMRYQTAVHPQGLTSITYKKNVNGNDTEQGYKLTNEEYVYKKISDTESFAVSTNKIAANAKSYVYKNIDTVKNVYSIVNTYTKDGNAGNNEQSDNVWHIDPYAEDVEGGKIYQPYAAKMDIVDNYLYNDYTNYNQKYQITEREAYRNVNMAAHYSSALEYEIWQSIRGDFGGEAIINAANKEGSHCTIVSTPLVGGFQVDVNSQLEYNHEESGSTADVTQQYAYVYSATFIFSANGDLYSLDYVEDYYTKSSWDFVNHAPKSGSTGVKTKIDVTYGYNERFDRSAVLGTFDPSIYFVSSIDSLSFYNPVAGERQNGVSVMNYDDSLDIVAYGKGGKNNAVVDTFTYSPATALDTWQYGFISSTDRGVADKTPWGPKTVGVGTATVTFGNRLENDNGPTKDVTIAVNAKGKFNSLYVDCNVQNYDSFDGDRSDTIYGYAGKTMKYYIDSGNNSGCPVSYHMVFMTKDKRNNIVYSNSSPYFTVVNSVGTYYDADDDENYIEMVGHDMILNFNTEAALALTDTVQVDISMESDFYNSGFGPSVIHLVIGPSPEALAGSTYAVTRNYAEPNDDKKLDENTLVFNVNGTGKLTEKIYNLNGTMACINEFNFTYTELNNGRITASITSVNIGEAGMPTTAYSYTIVIERKQDGRVGVCLYTDDEDIFGLTTEYGDGGLEVEGLTPFEKVN